MAGGLFKAQSLIAYNRESKRRSLVASSIDSDRNKPQPFTSPPRNAAGP